MKESSKKDRYLIITPTYNEKVNLQEFIPRVLGADKKIDILFVDDNSPDGTAKYIKQKMHKEKRIFLLEREKKMGLGTAYIAGFKYGIEKKYKYIFEMDADLSHNPIYLASMIDALKKGNDVVIGSRYIKGISVAHWPLKRLILSKGANVYARIITGVKIKDLTAGFVGYKRTVLEKIDFHYIKSTGYAFQIEMKYRCHLWGFSMKEVPIIFADREEGESKMSKKIIIEALLRCLTLRFTKKPRQKTQKKR